MKGMVTEIERFALNDGPGIRTTVFLKGCNMKCAWCHNPETINFKRELMYYPDKCIGCFKCVYACPCKAHKKIDDKQVFFPRLCVQCGKCASVCYAGAMAMSGSLMTVEQVMKEILQDKAYYTDSRGGVTLSGGEVLMQQEFAEALADACHAEGIQIGIESNLSLPWKKIEPFINKLDLIMCDLKVSDTETHKKWTGIGNEQIKENILLLARTGKPYIIRTPVIPGATDTDENIREIAKFLKDANVQGTMMYYELLNYNPLGTSKYNSLLKPNAFGNAKPLAQERMVQLQNAAAAEGITVRIE